jgi:hypothetical protein
VCAVVQLRDACDVLMQRMYEFPEPERMQRIRQRMKERREAREAQEAEEAQTSAAETRVEASGKETEASAAA